MADAVLPAGTGPVPAGPLAGVRVLDFSRLAPGPMATAILGDLGADVIQVEEPGGGRRVAEEQRLRGADSPPAGVAEARRRANPFGRHKRSIALNLKHPRGRQIALELGTRADVVMEGFRPGVMARLGLDFAAFEAVNPRAIYCSISGYGQDGPRRDRVGHDLNYIADAGLLALFAPAGSARPIVPPNLLADYAGGSYQAVIAIVSALFSRTVTGRGQYIDVSLAEGALALLQPEASAYAASGVVPRGGATRLTGAMAYYNVYETADGRYISLGCNEPAFFRELCDVLELPHLIDRQQDEDPAWQTTAEAEIAARIRSQTLAEWDARFAPRDIAFSPVRSMDEVLADPHYQARGMLHHTETPAGPRTLIGSPFHFSGTPVRPPTGGRLAGEDTTQVLRELGLGEDAVLELRTSGVVA